MSNAEASFGGLVKRFSVSFTLDDLPLREQLDLASELLVKTGIWGRLDSDGQAQIRKLFEILNDVAHSKRRSRA